MALTVAAWVTPDPEKSAMPAIFSGGPGWAGVRAATAQAAPGSPAGRSISASPPASAPDSVAARSAGRPPRRSRRGRSGANTASPPAGTVTVATGTGFGSVLTAIG
ncbi:hypothetical protein ACU4GA_08850 [Methylobacterium oryzae CBMB20]